MEAEFEERFYNWKKMFFWTVLIIVCSGVCFGNQDGE
jgi:hypothetical protein